MQVVAAVEVEKATIRQIPMIRYTEVRVMILPHLRVQILFEADRLMTFFVPRCVSIKVAEAVASFPKII